MIDAKDKARELLNKYIWIAYAIDKFHAKKCALIAVENEYNSKIQAYNEMLMYEAAFYAEKERQEVIKQINLL